MASAAKLSIQRHASTRKLLTDQNLDLLDVSFPEIMYLGLAHEAILNSRVLCRNAFRGPRGFSKVFKCVDFFELHSEYLFPNVAWLIVDRRGEYRQRALVGTCKADLKNSAIGECVYALRVREVQVHCQDTLSLLFSVHQFRSTVN